MSLELQKTLPKTDPHICRVVDQSKACAKKEGALGGGSFFVFNPWGGVLFCNIEVAEPEVKHQM